MSAWWTTSGSWLFSNILAMTELTKQQIKEFQDIWREEYGEDISEEEAYKRGSRLVELMRLVVMGKARRMKNANLSSNQE